MEESSEFSSNGVRMAFLEFFVVLLCSYKNAYITSETEAARSGANKDNTTHDLNQIFAGDGQYWNKKQFLHEQSRLRHIGRDVRSFLARVTETQMFEDFVRSHAPRKAVTSDARRNNTKGGGSNTNSTNAIRSSSI